METARTHHFVGLDGGGTGCRAVIADADGHPIGTGTGGPANFATDPDATIRNVRAALDRAARDAGLTNAQLAVATIHIGLAGILRSADGARVAAALELAQACVTEDRLTSLAGALGDRDGALAAIGTGTSVTARRGDRIRTFGGWGLGIGDQASGAWLGRAALEAALLAHDGVTDGSDITAALLARFAGDPAEMVAFAGGASPADYAALAPDILDAAEAGDPTGHALMRRGADYLDACFAAADLAPGEIVCLSGGIGPRYASFLSGGVQARLAPPDGTALDGALRLARARGI
ncbi:MAG: BadF/BadG/BcrA/BcrD ATPase family protein, partial [Pseudomonadota bacterium]